MHRHAVAFGIQEEAHVAHVLVDEGFGLEDPAAGLRRLSRAPARMSSSRDQIICTGRSISMAIRTASSTKSMPGLRMSLSYGSTAPPARLTVLASRSTSTAQSCTTLIPYFAASVP